MLNIDQLEKIADQGHAEAMFVMGQLYEEGKFVPYSINKAIQWYIRSANLSQPLAQHNLALIYLAKQQAELALSYFVSAALLGYAPSALNAGVLCQKGLGTALDQNKSIEYYQLAVALAELSQDKDVLEQAKGLLTKANAILIKPALATSQLKIFSIQQVRSNIAVLLDGMIKLSDADSSSNEITISYFTDAMTTRNLIIEKEDLINAEQNKLENDKAELGTQAEKLHTKEMQLQVKEQALKLYEENLAQKKPNENEGPLNSTDHHKEADIFVEVTHIKEQLELEKKQFDQEKLLLKNRKLLLTKEIAKFELNKSEIETKLVQEKQSIETEWQQRSAKLAEESKIIEHNKLLIDESRQKLQQDRQTFQHLKNNLEKDLKIYQEERQQLDRDKNETSEQYQLALTEKRLDKSEALKSKLDELELKAAQLKDKELLLKEKEQKLELRDKEFLIREREIEHKFQLLLKNDQTLKEKDEKINNLEKDFKNIHKKITEAKQVIAKAQDRKKEAEKAEKEAHEKIKKAQKAEKEAGEKIKKAEEAEKEALENEKSAQKKLILIKTLIEKTEKHGCSPLIDAAFLDDYKNAQELLPNSDPNICDDSGRSALHYAVINKSNRMVQLLLTSNLKKPIDPNIRDNMGLTPLQYASQKNYKNYEAIITLLLQKEHGISIDVNVKDKYGQTPFDNLKSHVNEKQCKKLRKRFKEAEKKRSLMFAKLATVRLQPNPEAWYKSDWTVIDISAEKWGLPETKLKRHLNTPLLPLLAAINTDIEKSEVKRAEELYSNLLVLINELSFDSYELFANVTHRLARCHITSDHCDEIFYENVINLLKAKNKELQSIPLFWVYFYLNAGDSYWQHNYESLALSYYIKAIWYLECKILAKLTATDLKNAAFLKGMLEQLYRRIDTIEALGYFQRINSLLIMPLNNQNFSAKELALQLGQFNKLIDYLAAAEQWPTVFLAYEKNNHWFEHYFTIIDNGLHISKNKGLVAFKNEVATVGTIIEQFCSHRRYTEALRLSTFIANHINNAPFEFPEADKQKNFEQAELANCYLNNKKIPPKLILFDNWRNKRDELQRYRQEFLQALENNPQLVLELQYEYSQKLIKLLKTRAEKTAKWFNGSLCAFSLNAIGSTARKTPFLFSDLECFIITDNSIELISNQVSLKKFVDFLIFDINLFCEYSEISKKDHDGIYGLHIDSGIVSYFNDPSTNNLVNTAKFIVDFIDPLKLLKQLNNDEAVEMSLQYSLYQPLEIYTNSEENQLFNSYTNMLLDRFEYPKENEAKLVMGIHQQLAIRLLIKHYADYKGAIKEFHDKREINIKERYLSYLTYWCITIAIYSGLTVRSLKDILESFEKNKILDVSVIFALKNMFIYLHNLRIKLQQYSGQQQDIVKFGNTEILENQNIEELYVLPKAEKNKLIYIDEHIKQLYEFSMKLSEVEVELTQLKLAFNLNSAKWPTGLFYERQQQYSKAISDDPDISAESTVAKVNLG